MINNHCFIENNNEKNFTFIFLPAMLSVAFDFYPDKISKYFLKNKNRTYIFRTLF